MIFIFALRKYQLFVLDPEMDSSIIGALIKVDDIEEIFLLLTLLLDSNADQAAEQEEFECFLMYPKISLRPRRRLTSVINKYVWGLYMMTWKTTLQVM